MVKYIQRETTKKEIKKQNQNIKQILITIFHFHYLPLLF